MSSSGWDRPGGSGRSSSAHHQQTARHERCGEHSAAGGLAKLLSRYAIRLLLAMPLLQDAVEKVPVKTDTTRLGSIASISNRLTLLVCEEADRPVACWAQLTQAGHVPGNTSNRGRRTAKGCQMSTRQKI
jgi:hypothetical protein